jgi:beta-phosphoglucomutase family hydrolase
MIKGVIFDLDGTMVDNMMIHHRAWQRKLAELGLDFTIEEVKEKVHGVNDEILIRLFRDRFNAEQRQQIADEKEAAYREIFLPEIKLIAGLPAFLEQLKEAGIPLAIGTAAPADNMNFVLDELQLRPYFRAAFHAGDVRQGKPHPEIFQKAAAALDLSADDCLVFEDSPTGIEAARRAGSKAVAITTTHLMAEFKHLPHVIRCVPNYVGMKWQELAG